MPASKLTPFFFLIWENSFQRHFGRKYILIWMLWIILYSHTEVLSWKRVRKQSAFFTGLPSKMMKFYATVSYTGKDQRSQGWFSFLLNFKNAWTFALSGSCVLLTISKHAFPFLLLFQFRAAGGAGAYPSCHSAISKPWMGHRSIAGITQRDS